MVCTTAWEIWRISALVSDCEVKSVSTNCTNQTRMVGNDADVTHIVLPDLSLS